MRKQKKNMRLKWDLLFLLNWPIIVALLSLALPYGFLVNSILLFGGISLFLAYQDQRNTLRALVFALPFSLVSGLIIDYFGHKDQSWIIPTIFPFRIFGYTTVEGLVWALLLSLSIILFYENFFDHSTHVLIARRMRLFIPVTLSIGLGFCLLVNFKLNPDSISYFYAKWIALMCLAAALFLVLFPRFTYRLLICSAYFFTVGMLQEVTALTRGYWYFPGHQFLGWVNFAGFRFPYEELLFWMFTFTVTVIAYFEFFDDNRLKLPAAFTKRLRI